MIHTGGRCGDVFNVKVALIWSAAESRSEKQDSSELMPKLFGFSEKIYKLWLHSIGDETKTSRTCECLACFAASDVDVRLRDFLCIFSAKPCDSSTLAIEPQRLTDFRAESL